MERAFADAPGSGILLRPDHYVAAVLMVENISDADCFNRLFDKRFYAQLRGLTESILAYAQTHEYLYGIDHSILLSTPIKTLKQSLILPEGLTASISDNPATIHNDTTLREFQCNSTILFHQNNRHRRFFA